MPQRKKTFRKPKGRALERNYQSEERYYTRRYRYPSGRVKKTQKVLRSPRRTPTSSLKYTNWEIYQHNAPPKGQLANLVLVIRATRGRMVYTARGYSPRTIQTRANKAEMTARAYDNALVNLNTPLSGLHIKITDMYYNRWSAK